MVLHSDWHCYYTTAHSMAKAPSPGLGAVEVWVRKYTSKMAFYLLTRVPSAWCEKNTPLYPARTGAATGLPARYWWLSQVIDLQDNPDWLIVCVHHRSGSMDAGMDLYGALAEHEVAWDDLEAVAVDEYRT